MIVGTWVITTQSPVLEYIQQVKAGHAEDIEVWLE